MKVAKDGKQRGKMKTAWSGHLAVMLSLRAPAINSGLMEPSRRIEGQFSDSREGRAFTAVWIYIEQGLGAFKPHLRRIANRILDRQRGEIAAYRMHCFAFGAEEELKKPRKPIAVRCQAFTNPAVGARTLSELSTETSPKGQSVISNLGGWPAHTDLVLFICRAPDSFRIAPKAEKQLRRCQRRTIWIYINDGDPMLEYERQRQMRIKNTR